MCRANRCDDNILSNNILIPIDTDDEIVDDSNDEHLIPRIILVHYIESFRNGQTNESFVTPKTAGKVMEFVYLLKNRTAPPEGMSDTMVHSWYNMKVTSENVIPFNQRTKTIDELIAHLVVDCNAKSVFQDQNGIKGTLVTPST